MNGDKFISTTNKFSNISNQVDDTNFFTKSETVKIPDIKQSMPLRHINDYDLNILRDGAYNDVEDEVFKLEYKIAKIEDEIKNVNKQLQMAEEIHDYYEFEQLTSRKKLLEKDLNILTDLYNEAGISAKISGNITSKIRGHFINAVRDFLSLGEIILSKFPGKISSVIEIKNSLKTLENINKSVDELMKSKYPYGEASEKYNQLSKYIARANTIQAEIYKFMK